MVLRWRQDIGLFYPYRRVPHNFERVVAESCCNQSLGGFSNSGWTHCVEALEMYI